MAECARNGTASITITGQNFVAKNEESLNSRKVQVRVAGKECTITTADPMRIICTLPRLRGTNLPVVVMQVGGRISADSLLIDYEPCPLGTEEDYSSLDPSICKACNATNGLVRPEKSLSECVSCSAYKNRQHYFVNGTCRECPPFSKVGHDNDGSCACFSSHFKVLSTNQMHSVGFYCAECPVHAICNGQSPLPSVHFVRAMNDNKTMIPCLNTVACVDDTTVANATIGGCANPPLGYKPGGNMCAECIEPANGVIYTLTAQHECAECDSKATIYTLVISVVLLVFIGSIVWCRRLIEKSREPKQSIVSKGVLVKMVLSSFQVNSVALTFPFKWPGFLNVVLVSQSTIAGFATNSFAVSCLVEEYGTSAQLLQGAVALFLPFGVIAGAGLYFAAALALYFKTTDPDNSGSGSRRSSIPLSKATGRKNYIEHLQGQCITFVIFILFLAHPAISSVVLGMFVCINLGTPASTEHFYWKPDVSVKCWGPQHSAWISLVGIPAATLWVFGFPAIVLSYCWRHRTSIRLFLDAANWNAASIKEQAAAMTIKSRVYFLVQDYRADTYWWFLVVMLKKIVLLAGTVMFVRKNLLMLRVAW